MKHYFIELKEGLLISLKAIRANKLRSILTTIGIIIGIFAVTTMSTLIVGLEEAFVKSISMLGNDVLYVDKYEWFGSQNWREYRNRKDITYEHYEKLKEELSDYDAISINRRTFGRTIKYKEKNTQSTLIFGTDQEFVKTGNILPAEGRFINEIEVRSGRKVCVIGSDIAEALFLNDDPIGKTIKVQGNPFRVIGILEKQGSGFLGSFSLDGQIIVPLKAFDSALGSQRPLRIDIKVADVNKIEETREEVIAIMRAIRKVPPNKPDDFAVNRQDVFKDMYDQTVGIIAIAGIVITALSLFVGAIGIMNIMFVSVTERTKEIGIRKAIGAKTWSILIQFLAEAAIICLIGGTIGIMFSFPVSLIVDQFLPTTMPIDIVVIALLISATVGIISGFLPAYKASKMNPVDALRTE